ncbi:hypothetical protein E6C70_09660 [Glaciibacter flavus]|uniref:Uncharacterized protein n=1 Tax=Orlajensenia flava TaxID=2565934 RepID=A0A4S4FW37_9MICO|nr:hypothetical protein [Glaciibacter flavus]THG34511.1 hypothetical protein E6C70_09660 [Glaciibacter flavus]
MNSPAFEGPPTGDEMQHLLNAARANVLVEISAKPSARRTRWAVTGFVAAVLAFSAAGGAVATGMLNSGAVISESTTLAVPVPAFTPTDLIVTFTCLTPGSFTMIVSDHPNDPTHVACDHPGHPSTLTSEFHVTGPARARTVSIAASPGGTYSIDAEYVVRARFDYPTNAAGETFGMPESNATNLPDLRFVVGEDDHGKPVQGYIRSAEILAPAPSGLGSNLNWLAHQHEIYPHGQPLPMYASDGTSYVGTYWLYR